MDETVCWVLTSMDGMKESTLNKVVASVYDALVLIADGIHEIVPEQELINDAGAKLLGVLPHQLIISDMHTLMEHLNCH